MSNNFCAFYAFIFCAFCLFCVFYSIYFIIISVLYSFLLSFNILTFLQLQTHISSFFLNTLRKSSVFSCHIVFNTICMKQLLTVLPPVFLMFLWLFFINYGLIYFLFFFLVSFQYQKTKKRTRSKPEDFRVRFLFHKPIITLIVYHIICDVAILQFHGNPLR